MAADPALELIAGASAYAGTMLDGGAVHYAPCRAYEPYFGIPRGSGQHEKRFQVYAFLRPTVEYTWYNALLEGGLFSWRNSRFEVNKSFKTATLNPWISRIDYGVTVAFHRFYASLYAENAKRLIERYPPARSREYLPVYFHIV